jgi:predicted metal-dependent HD superfamily phosphohydrolase
MNPARWQKLMQRWCIAHSAEVFSALTSAYSEPDRHYHTGRHIDDCLAQLDFAPAIADSPEEVELALWFHDAVYKPTSSSNELKSAEWARSFLQASGADGARAQRVYDHILATRHVQESFSGDADLVVDVDLSILGREPETYDQFEQAIRREYKWVPWTVYRTKRGEILSSFLRRPNIYATEHFRNRFEARARANLARRLLALRDTG